MKRGRLVISIAVAALVLGVAACGGRTQSVLPSLSQSVPDATIFMPSVAGKIVLKPTRLAFKNVGSRFVKVVAVTDKGYTGKITENLKACKPFAKASVASGKGPSYKVKFTPLRSGKCSVTFTDTKKRKAVLPIVVTTPGPTSSPSPTPSPGAIVASPSSATVCPSTGVAACTSFSQTVNLSQANYSGSFSEQDQCASNVAHVVTTGAASFTVNGQAQPGTCTATFIGGAGKFISFSITVVGNVTASPAPVNICPSSGTDKCNSDSQTVFLAQANYSGTFTKATTCASNLATVAPLASNSYTVTGGSTLGSCTATFTGILGQSVQVQINVVNGIGINLKKEPHS